ncbi:MAG: SLC13 family permease [Anaerolineae bacterium]|nr:SLC13 family permease [Anaerolineae bacterium]MDW8297942.1 SLC13 family permease [Anaerolineae bacterium]
MELQALITVAVLVIAVGLFIWDRLRVDIVALLVLIALLGTGVITESEALAGFANRTVISIGALFIVGGAVFQTGLADAIANRILKIAGTSYTRLLLVLMFAVAFMSAFISSTGIVALLLPSIISIAAKTRLAPSRLLIPLSISALIGGSSTLIGTPPNLLAAERLALAGYQTFNFFSFTPISLTIMLASVLFVVTLGKRLLPERQAMQKVQPVTTPAELFKLYHLPESLYRLRVDAQSPLVGKTLAESNLREQFDLSVLSAIHAHGRRTGTLTANHRAEYLRPDVPIQANDILIVQGKAESVSQAAAYWRLAIMANEPVVEQDVITNEVGIAEVMLRPRSSALDKTLTELNFGRTHRLTVLDIRRPGYDGTLDLKTTRLRFGDMLLVQGQWKDIFALKKQHRRDYIVMGEPEAAEFGAFQRAERAPIVLIVLAVMVLAIMLNPDLLTLASLTAAVVVVLTGCITMDEAYQAIDWKTLFLIAGMLPLSTALVKVGLVDSIATNLRVALSGLGTYAVIAGLFAMTALVTQVLSNTVTTVLIAPIAIAAARDLGVAPQAFVMAVAIAASMAFATPIASPVNTLVMSPGNYKFSDYARIGVPLVLISMVITLTLLPLLFPL